MANTKIDDESPSSKMKKKKHEECNAKSLVKHALGKNQNIQNEQSSSEARKKDVLFSKFYNKK